MLALKKKREAEAKAKAEAEAAAAAAGGEGAVQTPGTAPSSSSSSSHSLKGRVDDYGSGISFLLGSHVDEGAGGGSTISLWEHSTQTLNEDLIAPSGLCVTLTHPEHHPAAADDASLDSDLLVACLGPTANDASGGGGGPGRDRSRTSLRYAYAASPTTGVLCVWVLDANHMPRSPRSGGASDAECDASVRLKLKPGEVLTELAPVTGASSSEGGGTAWLLAATSAGRVWKIYKTSRPLTLHAKLVRGKFLEKNVGSSEAEEGEQETGIVRGLYNYFTTPSKPSRRTGEETHPADVPGGAEASGTSEEDRDRIVALVTLPPLHEDRGSESIHRSPVRGQPPRKQQRIASASDAHSTRAVSLSASLVVKEWKVSLLSGAEGDDARNAHAKREGYVSKRELFPRHDDGTLNLECLRSNYNHDAMMEGDELMGYRHAGLMAVPSVAPDGRSILVVVRIARDDAESTRVYVVRIGAGPSPQILDAAWLDRYAGPSLASAGGTIDCVGLIAAEEGEGGDGTTGGVVAYVGFGPRGDAAGHGGVTVSAVHFHSASAPRVKDLDLYSNIVPSIVQHSLSYDSLTGGCIFLATSGLLGGATVRFPPVDSAADMSMGDEGQVSADVTDESLLHDEAVRTIQSHLQSAFRQYRTKLNDGGGHNPARSVIPPSIGTCSSRVLSAAVVLASNDFVSSSAGGGSAGTIPSSPFSPRKATSPVTVLRDKLAMHKDFVNFLVHAGAYRRVSTAGKIRLRDHGEMITAARALLVECQSYFTSADAAARAALDDARQNELAEARQMVMASLEGLSNDAMTLPHSWGRLQQLLSENPTSDYSQIEKDLVLLTSSSICHGIGQALRYRQNESDSLYDIPSYDTSSSPWTSSQEMLEVLFLQLQTIQQTGESILSTSVVFETDSANLRQYVEDISASALSGYRDVVQRNPDDEEAMKAYEETKLISVPLLRQYANENGDDLGALQASLAHSFFEGIVQICHDHRKSWRFQGPFSDQEADERYDIRPMLSNTSSGSPYVHLHKTRDYRTGLPFCGYVLRWYADRGFYAEVFELGKKCPNDLTRYVRNDDRLSELAWIQDLRVGGHDQATVGLLSLNSPLLFGDKQEGSMGLWEKDQMMSLAKLSNKLASAKTANPAFGGQRNALIENSLTLISAQRILQEGTEVGDEVALKVDDLLRLACEKINTAHDIDEMKRFGICGLAIASAKQPSDQSDAASTIWHTLINADIQTWKRIADENSMAVGGISEEELVHRVDGTAFFSAMYDFITTSPPGEKMQNVGFLNDQVRNQVLHLLRSDELAEVLTVSAEIIVAST
mmetsp:Transcript_20644/g.43398  ORF Transcript_20644/g.43398 Transcript_20644/m.43398 type:complete len:1312 (+) Transcript_20644:68-4003(+)